MDFMRAKLLDGRWFRVLTVIDQFTREGLALVADGVLNGQRVARALSHLVAERGAPESITADNGSEFASKAMDARGPISIAYESNLSVQESRSTMATSNPSTGGFARSVSTAKLFSI
jgi:transposase InsO family protein